MTYVTGLFKAVQDVKAVFDGDNYRILPVIFLRDDIYELIQDSDKNKWNDYKIELDWDIWKIQDLLAFRISRAIDRNGTILSFPEAWGRLVVNRQIGIGSSRRGKPRRQVPLFDYITRSTQLRPRDYVQFLQACAQGQLGRRNELITVSTVRIVDKAFSNYMRNELVDEVHGILPDIQSILDIISQIRKWSFSISEFRKIFDRQLASGVLQTKDVDFVLKILFHFSIIGNQPKQKQVIVFRYANKEARFNFNEQIIVHRGLFKALQIL